MTRAFGLCEDTYQLLFVQGAEGRDDRQAAHQFRDDTELQQIVGLDLLEDSGIVLLTLPLNLRAEADGLLIQPLLDDLFHPVKRAAADKEDIFGVDLNEFLMGVLAPALGRDVGHGTLQDLQQSLLHALAGYIRVMEVFSLLRAILSISST